MKYVFYIVLCLGLSYHSFAFADKYALVKDRKIIKFKTVNALDNIIKPKLLVHDYLPVDEGKVPIYDSITQIVTGEYTIAKNIVTRVYVVKDKNLAAAKIAKKERITMATIDEIRSCLDQMEQNEKTINSLEVRASKIILINSALIVDELREISNEVSE